ncbi:hypothetical protein OS493_028728 [Desmophyllum pertusum]|uniref:Uncharacterized protein n=1 Tax=Desmophyllum pertusum TaxID=174260 RepID=A0A9W9Y924_9CNID|nr:hypothetical protein OS493_028728 [Desmophyllum pertusum]
MFEENRNLCESETDKAECIREVEEAKEPVNEDQPEDESANQQEESKSDEPQTMEEHLEMLDRVRRESEENRKYWKEEMKSMNKWEKYGLG